MTPGYDSIILPVIVKDDKLEDYYINKCNVNYFRPYGPPNTGNQFKVPRTAIFMNNSSNLLQVNMSPQDLDRMLGEEKVSLAGLDPDQRVLIKRMIEFYHKERSDSMKKGA